MAVTFRRPCRCGHVRGAHEHYRSGTDCSACDCLRYAGRFEIILRIGRIRPGVVIPEAVPYPSGPYVRPTHSPGRQVPLRLPAQLEPLRPREASDVPRVPEKTA